MQLLRFGDEPYQRYDWTVVRGDSGDTLRFALLDREGGPVDLSQWEIAAQARDRHGELAHVFELDVGILIGQAEVTFADGREPVTTATVRLHKRRGDLDELATGPGAGNRFDVEISRGPDVVKTIVGGQLAVLPDVTRG